MSSPPPVPPQVQHVHHHYVPAKSSGTAAILELVPGIFIQTFGIGHLYAGNVGTGLLLITHDMGVVAETAQRVSVMYAGQVVENRSARDLFTHPQHPYTGALLDALPERAIGKRRLPTIPGVVPGIADRPRGCLFNPRCAFVQEKCRTHAVPLFPDESGTARCFYPLQVTGGVAA